MTKQNKKTFAQRAKDIQKKYTRATTDPIEARDMEAELEQLMQEQEAVRESMGLNQEQQQFAGGGRMKYDGFNSTQFLPIADPATMQGLGITSLLPEATNPYLSFSNPTTNYDTITNNILPISESLQGKLNATLPAAPKKGDNFFQRNKEYLPSIISGASNIGSNLLLAALSKNNKANLTPAMGVPERINLEPQAEQLRRDATVAKNVASRNARNLGVNSGQALANMGAIGADIDRNLGANLTNLYLGQEGANVGAANQFNLANMQAANQAGMFNEQSRLQNNSNRLDYLAGALGTVPGVMKDIRQQQQDDKMMGVMESYYGSLGGRHYLPVGSIFGEGAFKYKVIGYNPNGTYITEKVS